MPFKTQWNNVYCIDTQMFGFPEYMSCYLVKGKELALVDTGMADKLDYVLAGIKGHGFSVEDITHIFVTHCEHPDHSGNAGSIVELAPKAKVYVNPVGLKNLLDPSIQHRERMATLPEKMWKRFQLPKPTPRDRIVLLEDGQVINLGDDVKLKFVFTPAHQPSGYIIFDLKNNGLFINDLGGIYFDDCGYHLILHPPGSGFFYEYEYLRKLIQNPPAYLYLGHYGIVENGPEHIQRALTRMEWMIETGKKCLADGHKEQIAVLINARNQLEADKLLKRGDMELYDYASIEHIPPQAQNFAGIFLDQFDR